MEIHAYAKGVKLTLYVDLDTLLEELAPPQRAIVSKLLKDELSNLLQAQAYLLLAVLKMGPLMAVMLSLMKSSIFEMSEEARGYILAVQGGKSPEDILNEHLRDQEDDNNSFTDFINGLDFDPPDGE